MGGGEAPFEGMVGDIVKVRVTGLRADCWEWRDIDTFSFSVGYVCEAFAGRGGGRR